jgi:hypothetical protein
VRSLKSSGDITFSLSGNTSYCFLGLENSVKIGPAMVRDTNSVERSIINTTRGINERKSPRIPGSVRTGINAESVVIVPIIIGDLYSRSAIRIAVRGLYH